MNRSAADFGIAIPSALPPTGPSLAQWQRSTREAIASRNDGRLAAALAQCRAALGIALELIEQPGVDRIDDRIAALVVSRLNLADVQVDCGELDAAVEQLCEAHASLMRLVLCGDSARQQAALRHSRHTHAALLEHLTRHGADPHIARTLRIGVLTLSPGQWALH